MMISPCALDGVPSGERDKGRPFPVVFAGGVIRFHEMRRLFRGKPIPQKKSASRNAEAHQAGGGDALQTSADAFPGLAAAEQSAEGAALNLENVRSLHRDGGVVVLAAVGVVDAAGPLRRFRLHVDQDALAGVDGIAAEIGAALFDADVALVLFGL